MGETPSLVRQLDLAKQGLDDKISIAIRKGAGNKARELMKLKSDLLAEIDYQVPSYGAARNIFAGSKSIDDAADLGRAVFTNNKVHVRQLTELMSTATDSEVHAFRAGIIRGAVDKLENSADHLNSAQKLVPNKRVRDLIRTAFPDDEKTANQFLQKLEFEHTMANTHGKLTGGSATAERLTETGDLGFWGLTATDPVVGIAANILKKLGVKTQDPRVVEEIGNLLFKPGFKAKDLNSFTHRLYDGLIKNEPNQRQIISAVVGGQQAGSQAGQQATPQTPAQ